MEAAFLLNHEWQARHLVNHCVPIKRDDAKAISPIPHRQASPRVVPLFADVGGSWCRDKSCAVFGSEGALDHAAT